MTGGTDKAEGKAKKAAGRATGKADESMEALRQDDTNK